MPPNPGPPYSLALNITAWVLQLPVCLVFLFDLVVKLSVICTALANGSILFRPYVIISIICILSSVGFTLSTIVSEIVEIVKIARRRMPLAQYLDFVAWKTVLYAAYLLVGLVIRWPLLIITGGIMSITSIVQLWHGVWVGDRMRKAGIAMTDEYELLLDPADTEHLETGYGELELSTTYNDGAYANSPLPPKENGHSAGLVATAAKVGMLVKVV
ncbi:hypothetical protein F4859DRAFT_514642 [Xylaria cf. heliscus]|nr:hypothetical protein F4859DRAFT_514642 [Xylaria cf. heliscus]